MKEGVIRFWANPKIRSAFFQTAALLAVVVIVSIIGHNTVINLQRQGVASGFDFLGKTAGFDIIQHLIPYSEQDSYGRAFFVALMNTLVVSVIGVGLATVLGFILGLARLSQNWLVARLALVYIEIVRNVPLLLQLFFWYFAVLRSLPSAKDSYAVFDIIFLNIRGLYVPSPVALEGFRYVAVMAGSLAIGAMLWIRKVGRQRYDTGSGPPAVRISLAAMTVLLLVAYLALDKPLAWESPVLRGFNFVGGLSLLPELVALLLALTIYTAAFIAEIVRAGILSVSRGQWEAALSLGLSRGQTLRQVVLPQAMRVIVPPMTSQYLNLTKNSSLAAAIAYPDLVLVFAGTVLMQTGQAVEVIAMTMAVYLTISLAISWGMNRYNRSMAIVER